MMAARGRGGKTRGGPLRKAGATGGVGCAWMAGGEPRCCSSWKRRAVAATRGWGGKTRGGPLRKAGATGGVGCASPLTGVASLQLTFYEIIFVWCASQRTFGSLGPNTS